MSRGHHLLRRRFLCQVGAAIVAGVAGSVLPGRLVRAAIRRGGASDVIAPAVNVVSLPPRAKVGTYRGWAIDLEPEEPDLLTGKQLAAWRLRVYREEPDPKV